MRKGLFPNTHPVFLFFAVIAPVVEGQSMNIIKKERNLLMIPLPRKLLFKRSRLLCFNVRV